MGNMRNTDDNLSLIFSHPSCIMSELYVCSPGMPPMASIAPPLSGVPPLPLPPLPVGVSPPLVSSAPPPLPQPIANGAPPTGMMQPISGFSHPGNNTGDFEMFWASIDTQYLHYREPDAIFNVFMKAVLQVAVHCFGMKWELLKKVTDWAVSQCYQLEFSVTIYKWLTELNVTS